LDGLSGNVSIGVGSHGVDVSGCTPPFDGSDGIGFESIGFEGSDGIGSIGVAGFVGSDGIGSDGVGSVGITGGFVGSDGVGSSGVVGGLFPEDESISSEVGGFSITGSGGKFGLPVFAKTDCSHCIDLIAA
jgi:hypothetical protein